MPYDEALVNRIRESLVHLEQVEEKRMFGGVCFMVKGKMCLGVIKDELMCRYDPKLDATVLEKEECRPMDFTGRPLKGFAFVNHEGIKTKAALQYWIDLCLEFNEEAPVTIKKKKSRKKD
jgi:TfoX/Sxy family transcriptional regulator of competence genes